MKGLFKSFVHLGGRDLFVFSLSVLKVLYNFLDASPLLNIGLTKILPVCPLSFQSSKNVFHRAKVLHFDEV